MDERNIYENRSEGRRVTEQSDEEVSEQTKETDAEKARMDRRRRRAGRRALCRCGERSRARTRTRTSRRILSQNPFIIFYLEMYFKSPEKRVTEVARQAGKEWCALPKEERMKYIQLAERERKRRRGGRRTRRRRGCP